MSVGDEIFLSGLNNNHEYSQYMESVDDGRISVQRNLFGKDIIAASVDHSYEPKFEDESYEVGQENTFTEEQISMIQSQKTSLPQESVNDNDDDEEVEE
jgi:hypothetical protein